MKKTLVGILAGILLGSCYKPPENLDFPNKQENTPYVCYSDNNRNISILTLKHTEHYIDEAKDKIVELANRADLLLGKREIPLEVIMLHSNDYFQLMKKYWPNKPERWIGFGLYYIPERFVVLNSRYKGFSESEQRVFVWEYIHLRDFEDNKEDLTNRDLKRITNKILGKPLIPFAEMRLGEFGF